MKPFIGTISETVIKGTPSKHPSLNVGFVAAYEVDGELLVSVNGDEPVWFSPTFYFDTLGRGVIDSLTFTNPTDDPVAFKAFIGTGSMVEPNAHFVAPQFKSGADVPVPNAAATLLVAANNRRMEVVITNRAANAGALNIGDSAMGAGEGAEIAAGQGVVLATRGAVYAYHTNGGSMNVGIAELLR